MTPVSIVSIIRKPNSCGLFLNGNYDSNNKHIFVCIEDALERVHLGFVPAIKGQFSYKRDSMTNHTGMEVGNMYG